jgi:hypothetical protein
VASKNGHRKNQVTEGKERDPQGGEEEGVQKRVSIDII